LARQGVPARILRLASQLAACRGTAPRDELLAFGLDRDRYWRSIALDLGIAFAPELGAAELVVDAHFVTTEVLRRANTITVRLAGETLLVRAPEPEELPELARRLRGNPTLARRLRIAAPETIRAVLVARRNTALSSFAVNRLARALPRFSARRLGSGRDAGSPRLLASAGLGVILVAPQHAAHAILLLAALFFANCAFWKLAAALSHPRPLRLEPLASRELPTYTVLVPLYREAAVVPDLLYHLGHLDYPASKLQVLLVLEEDDLACREAVAAQCVPPMFETVIVPSGGPRTKPKALTYALAFARGELVVVYDAEDRPEPDQLRKAAAAFCAYPDLGCVQARLQPDNQGTWFARMFTVEYAAVFEVLLPALAAWRLPMPLGGTSNHFPRAVVDKVGAWDPFNVTEDADLGIRLARFGYRAATLASRTFEEAPIRLSQWLPQRRRWIKGWMQTALLCFAGPVPAGLRLSRLEQAAVHGVITAGVLGLLLYPVSLLVLTATTLALLRGDFPADAWTWAFLVVTLGNGAATLLGAAVAAWRGLRASSNLRLAPLILCLPLYWGLMSVAAWQALVQLMRNAALWEKTRHGVATDRRTPARTPCFAASRPVKGKRRRRPGPVLFGRRG